MSKQEQNLSTIKGNFGCGSDIREGYINVDNNQNSNPDVAHDLTKFPYPFQDNYFDEILLHHVLEHLPDVFPVMEELFRISKNNTVIKIHVPHFSANWMHPGHKTAFSTNLFYFFDHEREEINKEIYGKTKFKIITIRVKWMTFYNKKNLILRFLNNTINYIANKNLKLMERIWCYWVGGFEEIYFEVKVVK